MPDNLVITETRDRIPILHLSGHLTSNTVQAFMEHARQVKESGARFLLIDMSEVGLVTSAGLLALHNCYKIFTPPEEAEGWKNQNPGDLFKSPYLKLAGASTDVYYVLSLAGFIHNIPIYANIQEALRSFEG